MAIPRGLSMPPLFVLTGKQVTRIEIVYYRVPLTTKCILGSCFSHVMVKCRMDDSIIPITYSILSRLYVFVNIFFLFSWNIFAYMRHERRWPCSLFPSALFLYAFHFVVELFKPFASIMTSCVPVLALVTRCIIHHIIPLLFRYSSTLFR